MKTHILLVCLLLLAARVTEAKSTFKRHKILRQVSTQCEEGKVKCQTSDNCIRESWICDGDNDCGDDSDEPPSCPRRECYGDYFKCSTRNRCIARTEVCDGSNNCIDNSDELPDFCENRVCLPSEFRCNNGQCVDVAQYCTWGWSSFSCSDNTDMSGVCVDFECPESYLQCPSDGKCIVTAHLCDGQRQCSDGWDEQQQQCHVPLECWSGEARCSRLRRCINANYFCDSDNDCTDNSDEDPSFCASRTCGPDRVRCNNGQCLDKINFCAGYPRCRDGSLSNTAHICHGMVLDCPSGHSQCSGTVRCINKRYFCDTDNDCGDNSDEDASFCNSRSCEHNEVHCVNGQCINRDDFCNHHITCRDSSFVHSDLCPGEPTTPFTPRDIPWNDPAFRNCSFALGPGLGRRCGRDPFGGLFEGMNDVEMAEKAIETELEDICRPAQVSYTCLETTFEESCAAVRHYLTNEENMIKSGRIAFDYVCQEQIDVINRHKACLLRLVDNTEGQRQLFLLARTMEDNCLQFLDRHGDNPMCAVTPELQACVKHAVVEQCGEEIAEVLNELADRVMQATNCPERVAHHGPSQNKRRGFLPNIKAFNKFF